MYGEGVENWLPKKESMEMILQRKFVHNYVIIKKLFCAFSSRFKGAINNNWINVN